MKSGSTSPGTGLQANLSQNGRAALLVWAQDPKPAKVDPAEKAWAVLTAKRDGAIDLAREQATSQEEFNEKLKETLAGLDEEVKAFIKTYPDSPQAFDARLELANLLAGLFGKRDEAKAVLAEAVKSAKTVEQFSNAAIATARLERNLQAGMQVIEDALAATKAAKRAGLRLQAMGLTQGSQPLEMAEFKDLEIAAMGSAPLGAFPSRPWRGVACRNNTLALD